MRNIVISYLEYGVLATAIILLCALATHWLLEDKNARRTSSRNRPSATSSDSAGADRPVSRDRSV